MRSSTLCTQLCIGALFLATGIANGTTVVILVHIEEVQSCNQFVFSYPDFVPQAEPLHLAGISCLSSDPDYLDAVRNSVEKLGPYYFAMWGSVANASLDVRGGEYEGASLAMELLCSGLAAAADDAPEKYRAAEREARSLGRGWWGRMQGAVAPPPNNSFQRTSGLRPLAAELMIR